MANLHIANLAKSFGSQAVLRDVSLDVAPGRLVAILGSSGSGKTTLLRLVCGFEHADAGVIEIDGQPVAGPGLHVPPERRRIGYVAQEGALFPHLSVADNIVFGLPRRARRARCRVAELLELVGLPGSFADRPPQALSGGEQQRVALARALAPTPRLVLLDEPFSALDAALRAETRTAVTAALAAADATAVLVTHDQAEALSMGHEVAVLREGRLVQVSDPVTLYRHPRDAALASFVGEVMVVRGEVRGARVTCALGELALASFTQDGPADVLVRPEQVRLDADPQGADPQGADPLGHTVRAQVCAVAFYGHDALVELKLLPASGVQSVSARVAGYQVPAPGTVVGLSVEGEVTAFPIDRDGGDTASEPISARRDSAGRVAV